MLESISIRNYVLIDELDIDFGKGFSTLTGETGAGKSIILGAMGLLSGQRADSKSIRHGADKCVVEGHFNISGHGLEGFFTQYGLEFDETDTIIRRELMSSGKSRAFINDTPVSLAQLKELAQALIDIHSQHQNLALGTTSFQTGVVDTISGNDGLLSNYRKAFRNYRDIQARLEELKSNAARIKSERDFVAFQLDELKKASLADGELQELEEESQILEHSEQIKTDLYQASEILDSEQNGVIQGLKLALHTLKSAARNYRSAEELAERMESTLIELRDISGEVSDSMESISFDPARQDQVNDRLDTIYTLLKKHGKETIAELLEIQQDFSDRLCQADSLDEDIEKLASMAAKAVGEVRKCAAQLTESRTKAASSIEKRISALLIPLGIPDVRFKIEITPKETPDITGADNLRFMFSANKSVPMQDISNVASGGEIARVMLSIKSLMAGTRLMPTIIFDEIDTGVSGAVAEKMAVLMKQMTADGIQVLTITHLPQIAALGETHYKVYKESTGEQTHTRIAKLAYEERINELAGMMSGSTLTSAAIENAKALIDNGR